MQKAHDIFEVKLSWKGIEELEEVQQKFNTLLETEEWKLNSIKKFYEKEEHVVEHLLKQPLPPKFDISIPNWQ